MGVRVAASAAAVAVGMAVLGGRQILKLEQDSKPYLDLLDQYDLDVTPEKRDALIDDFKQQMDAALRGDKSGLLMLPTYVTCTPDGSETGSVFAIDLGGTNFRMQYLQLSQKNSKVDRVVIHEKPVPFEVKTGTGEALFDFMAQSLVAFIVHIEQTIGHSCGEVPTVGFCFSFATDQTALNSGKLLLWTKGFTASGVVGEDVVALLEAALERAGRRCRVGSLLNDTVGVLAASLYLHPTTEVGIIVGTGTNAAYVEQVGAVRKWTGHGVPADALTMINVEWCNFSSPHLPRCHADEDMDAASTHPGEYLYEKMVSGLYLGEVLRCMLLRLAKEHRIFGEVPPAVLLTKKSISTADVCSLAADWTPFAWRSAALLRSRLGLTHAQVPVGAARLASKLAWRILMRSARMVAIGTVALLQRSGWVELTTPGVLAFDGGVYEKAPLYRRMMVQALAEALGDKAAVKAPLLVCKNVHDGSCLGAAVLVLLADKAAQEAAA